ncbi:damage-control phosphatase ARMT1 family protein [Polymorphospora sp. NPDC050346]|uniref:damage-control phosphatase ARMT1 family protein n=1 Tax=Polymorphospora sp. NPDC050346 TaxID=3155780 RepID=UPI0033E439E2
MSAAVPAGVAPILSNSPGSLAWHVWHERHPALIDQLAAAHPYPPEHLTALRTLLAETLTGPVRPLPPAASDRATWDGWGADHFGRSWLDVPFLWAESYFYRRLLEAVGFFTPGPWLGLDPFAFLKAAELDAPDLADDLGTLEGTAGLTAAEKTRVLLHGALWGNQADLGFRIGVAATSGTVGPSAHLVADDTTAAVSALTTGRGTVCLVADNAGRELLSDLVLVDHLLHAEPAERVTLHLKPYPYYVSDATTADLVGCLRRLAAGPPAAAGIADRLRTAAADGRLDVATHWFYCAPHPYHRMPDDLADTYAEASVVVLKGDLNYRRLVGDCRWPETTPFADTVDYFPAPLVALRTLKSDVVVGLDAADVAALDSDPAAGRWRVDGRYGLVQVRA